jgi:hypothetical protein
MDYNSERIWYGIYLGDGHWLSNADSLRIGYEAEEMAHKVLARLHERGEFKNGVVKSFPSPAPSMILGV